MHLTIAELFLEIPTGITEISVQQNRNKSPLTKRYIGLSLLYKISIASCETHLRQTFAMFPPNASMLISIHFVSFT